MPEVPAINPFEAPREEATLRSDDFRERAEDIAFRRAHLSHETSLRAIGLAYLLTSIVLSLAAFGYLVDPNRRDSFSPLLAVALFGGVASVMLAGVALRLLSPWSWLPVILVICLGLVLLKLGTLINLYVVYMILCRKGRIVCSPAYHQVIRRTPEIRYRTSPVLLTMIGLVLLIGIAGALVYVF
jgi:hypothetical protein